MSSKINLSNTSQRILSAFAMTLLLIVAAYIGRPGLIALGVLAGILCVDEFLVHMIKIKRTNIHYLLSNFTFIFGCYYFFHQGGIDPIFIYLAVFQIILLTAYLFLTDIDSERGINIFTKNAYTAGLFFLLPISAFLWLLGQENFVELLFFSILISSMADIGGWFFGKNFGRKKLWPAISPNKTWIGSIGGIITALLITGVYSWYVLDVLNLNVLICLGILPIVSQLGDLFQSKLKRQYKIKDSSNLIPGHGGVYDRIDSLVFVLPFFVIMIMNFY